MLCIHDERSTASRGVMRAMFAARKQVFVDLLAWDLPVLAGTYEVDQYDDHHARYLILADANGGHLASARLLPTMRPHLLDQRFGALCEETPPRGPSVYEITRFCLDRRLRAAERRHWRDTLVVSLAHYAIEHAITTYVGVAETGWLEQILAFGWDAAPLGQPRMIGGMRLGALRIEIGPETPALLAARGMTASVDLEAAAA